MGSGDRVLRIGIGGGLSSLLIMGDFQWAWAFVPIAISGIYGWCPIYAFIGKLRKRKS